MFVIPHALAARLVAIGHFIIFLLFLVTRTCKLRTANWSPLVCGAFARKTGVLICGEEQARGQMLQINKKESHFVWLLDFALEF